MAIMQIFVTECQADLEVECCWIKKIFKNTIQRHINNNRVGM